MSVSKLRFLCNFPNYLFIAEKIHAFSYKITCGTKSKLIINQFTNMSKKVSRSLATRCPILASNKELSALSPSEVGTLSGQISVYIHIKIHTLLYDILGAQYAKIRK